MSYFSGTVNAMPKGGSSVGDTNPGGGVGIIKKHQASGLGSNWNMGDALSSPKGEWDNLLDLEEDFDDLNDEIESLAFLSFNRLPTDSLAHKGAGIGYLGGIGSDMSAVIGMSAGYQPKGRLVAENQLKKYIKEVLMAEASVSSISSSGRIAVLASNQGENLGSEDDDAYGEPLASTNTADAAPKGHLPTSRSAVNYKGYYQSHNATTDGAETLHNPLIGINYQEDADAFENGKTTGEISQRYDDERNDYLNTRKHI